LFLIKHVPSRLDETGGARKKKLPRERGLFRPEDGAVEWLALAASWLGSRDALERAEILSSPAVQDRDGSLAQTTT
ncbi:MAG: hypothetical protein M3Q89_12560, partial [Verrucomicrobiota bacterium]|nr:hypothetical protein [Verrucomicrobiota bacterium]